MSHTVVAVDKTTDTIVPIQVEDLSDFSAYDAANLLYERPKLVLFIPQIRKDVVHSHMRYHRSRGCVKHRLCHITDIPARVRAAFLLAH